MPRLIVESNAVGAAPFAFSADSGDLLALLSFGYAEPFGSQHPLTVFVRRLKTSHGVDVTPLVTFYDHDVSDAQDAANLEAAWQDPAPLAIAARAAAGVVRTDPAAAEMQADYPALSTLLLELAEMSDRAAAQAARIRLSFRMD